MAVRSVSRIPTGISLALLLGAAAAWAQPSPKAPAAPPTETVTVTGASSEAVNHFVQAAVTPTHMIGKVARWEVPICTAALGLPADTSATVVQRVKEVALQVGARIDSNPNCKPNVLIAFTSTPQDLLDNIRKEHTEWLGYHSSPEELARLSKIARPVQAWYSTATVDLQGHREIDGSRTNARDLVIMGPCVLIGGGGKTAGSGLTGNGYRDPNFMCTARLPNAIKTTVEGSRVADGLRASFDHVMIIANPLAVPAGIATITDYIAVLALAQINSLDTCQALPSITNLLAAGCAQGATGITANDLGYLKGVYEANPAGVPGLQQNEIAYRMEQGIGRR